jgi:hypothetical protein
LAVIRSLRDRADHTPRLMMPIGYPHLPARGEISPLAVNLEWGLRLREQDMK